jgi:hypothetical protein
MRTLILLATLFALPLPGEELSRSTLSEKDLTKFGSHIEAFYAALDEDSRRDQVKALEALEKDLLSAAKKAKVEGDPLRFPGDWEVVFEKAKTLDRALKSKAGKGFQLRTFEDANDGRPVTYLLSLPSSFGKGDELFPVILALKGPLGESGKALEGKVIEMADAMYGDMLDEAIVLVPIGFATGSGRKAEASEIEGSWLTEDGLYALFTSMRVLLEEVAYDRSRLIVDGWAEGGGDALRLASRAPYWFAGVINRSGPVGPDGDVLYANLQNIPVTYVNGATDGDDAADDAGVDLGPLTGIGAVVLEESGSAMAPSEETKTALATWCGEQEKNLAPEQLDFLIDDIIYQSNYWVKAARINRRANATPSDDDFPRIKASVDRGANKISIETTNIFDGVWVFLSDALIDLDKPVIIEVNGTERYNKEVRRSLQTMLENRYYNNSGDSGVYTVQLLIDEID